jgi:hypothetical protein
MIVFTVEQMKESYGSHNANTEKEHEIESACSFLLCATGYDV